MKVTVEALKFYEASDSLISFFKNTYGEEVTIEEILKGEKESLDLLFFLKSYFSFSAEEEELYNKKFSIDNNSFNVFESVNIHFSKNITLSTEVEDSYNIVNSKEVLGSSYIYDSQKIQKSNNIYNSNNVKNSSKIINSFDVDRSNDVFLSKSISESDIISHSANIQKSGYIYKSENLEDSYFCGFCKRVKHCLFCLGVEDKEYMIFNQEVPPQDFFQWKEELFFSLNGERKDFIEIHPLEKLKNDRFSYNGRLDAIFEGLSRNFYGWISSLPNYSEDVFLGLFFRDNEEFEK